MDHNADKYFLCIQGLSKLQISEEFKIQFKRDLQVIQSDQKCECPSKIIMICNQILGQQSAQSILQTLNGFFKYENIQKFFLEGSVTTIDGLYQKLSQFKNVKVLKIPYQYCDGENFHLLVMLKQLNKLTKLQLQSNKKNGSVNSEEIQGLVQFAIDQMGELRTLKLLLHHPIKIRDIDLYNRVYPINCTISSNNQLQYQIDTRFGLNEFPIISNSI
ncbi:hypothetical protein FGO68_gene3872 [Halteria grandinella]|uniref:Uncharacterized protein n=1 Tax=Halteria grandinella TaxID=5974 RepID=A0A8J8SXP4_HALGN|nr:hypothetical protein FGO68_gene3872 [Halteria grandinella]